MNGLTITFTFIFDPLWDESQILNEFKKKIKSNKIYYKYKMYLKPFLKAKTWKAFLKAKHNLPEELENSVIFWRLGDEIYTSYIKNKNKNDAIIFRAMWSISIDNLTTKENITSFTCYDYECDRSILIDLKEKDDNNND